MPTYNLTITDLTEDELENTLRSLRGVQTRAVESEPEQARAVESEPEQARAVESEPEQARAIQDENAPRDSEGFPFDPELHVGPDNLNQDGTFRAKRGKGQVEKDARAAWRASGGDEEPSTEDMVEQELPMIRTGDERVESPPVSYAALVGRVQELLTSGTLTTSRLGELYSKATGLPSNEAPAVFQVNESARALLLQMLNEEV